MNQFRKYIGDITINQLRRFIGGIIFLTGLVGGASIVCYIIYLMASDVVGAIRSHHKNEAIIPGLILSIICAVIGAALTGKIVEHEEK